MAQQVKRRKGAVAQIGGPRDNESGRTKRDKGDERPYARFREMVFLFTAVPAAGATVTAMGPQLSNDIDLTYKRGSATVQGQSNTAVSNNMWRVGYEYQAGDKITTPAQSNGSSFPQAQASLGTDGLGGWIDPPLRFRAKVVIQVTVFNDDPVQILNICVVFGVREWYFASDAEN